MAAANHRTLRKVVTKKETHDGRIFLPKSVRRVLFPRVPEKTKIGVAMMDDRGVRHEIVVNVRDKGRQEIMAQGGKQFLLKRGISPGDAIFFDPAAAHWGGRYCIRVRVEKMPPPPPPPPPSPAPPLAALDFLNHIEAGRPAGSSKGGGQYTLTPGSSAGETIAAASLLELCLGQPPADVAVQGRSGRPFEPMEEELKEVKPLEAAVLSLGRARLEAAHHQYEPKPTPSVRRSPEPRPVPALGWIDLNIPYEEQQSE